MTPVEYHVYLCCRDAKNGAWRPRSLTASRASASASSSRGRKRAPRPVPGARGDRLDPRLRPAFGACAAGAAGHRPDPRAADLAHAFKTRRNIVVLADPAHADPLAEAGRPGARSWRLAADRLRPGRTRESIALVGHRLLTSSDVDDRRLMRGEAAFVALGLVLAIAVASRAVPLAVRWWNRPAAPPPLPAFTLYWTAPGSVWTPAAGRSFPC